MMKENILAHPNTILTLRLEEFQVSLLMFLPSKKAASVSPSSLLSNFLIRIQLPIKNLKKLFIFCVVKNF